MGAPWSPKLPVDQRLRPSGVPPAREAHRGDLQPGLRVQLLPVRARAAGPVTQEGNLLTERSISPDGYGRFLIDVFEDWVRRDIGEVYVQMFDVALANWHGEPPSLCVHSETCGLALAIEHTGDLYSCDHFVEPAFKLGNIKDTHMIELIASPQQRKFGLDKRDTLAAVLPRVRCAVRVSRRVPEGPVHRRSVRRARPQLPVPELQGLLPPRRRPDAADVGAARGRTSPSELVHEYAAEDARRGRNDPCTCGSGRKWKHCHGAEAPVAV